MNIEAEFLNIKNLYQQVNNAYHMTLDFIGTLGVDVAHNFVDLFETEAVAVMSWITAQGSSVTPEATAAINYVTGNYYTSKMLGDIADTYPIPTEVATPLFEFAVITDNMLFDNGFMSDPSQSVATMLYNFFELFCSKLIECDDLQFVNKEGFVLYLNTQANYITANDLGGDPVFPREEFRSTYKSVNQIIDTTELKQSESEPVASNSSSSFESVMEELNSLVGLESIKSDVSNLISLVKMQKIREQKGLKTVPVSLHLVFTGNPGTGKTTVARLLAQLYKHIGVLNSGQLIEVDRSGLVAGYVGQTAIKTREKIDQAIGGVLFIDEAYTLAKEGNDYGQEAIDTLLKAMEDKRNQFVVIVAGYTEPMANFINSNPGLKSRFNKYFFFPDYSDEELVEIFDRMCRQYEYTVTPDAKKLIENEIHEMEDRKGADFANARDIRNLFENIITKQATRVSAMNNPSDDEVSTITSDDVK